MNTKLIIRGNEYEILLKERRLRLVPDFLSRSECHVFMDAADRAACAGIKGKSFYANQPGLNRFLAQDIPFKSLKIH